MSIAHRRYVVKSKRENWWRRYFWSQDEFWAKHAVHRAAYRARNAKKHGTGRYYFWDRVCLRAAAFCEWSYDPVPKLLVSRPLLRGPWSLSSPEVSQWLRVEPPYHRQLTKRP